MLGPRSGLDLEHACAANCDDLVALPKRRLGRRRGRLEPVELAGLDEALRVALGLD